MNNYHMDDFMPEAIIKREGIIRIVDEEGKIREMSAIYSIEEIICLLDKGHSLSSIIHRG